MDNSRFFVLQPRAGRSLTEQADDLQRQMQDVLQEVGGSLDNLLQMRVYVSDAANQCALLRSHRLVADHVPLGVVSFVEQPPLGGAKLALLLWFVGGKVLEREVISQPGSSGVVLKQSGLTYILHSVRFGQSSAEETAGVQLNKAFESHISLLRTQGLNLKDHCHRTWIYVRDVDCQYAQVVKARNEIFAREGLTRDTHYIASTGIGGATEYAGAYVATDFFSVDGPGLSAVGYLHATDYLNPTHEYGVAFERGTFLDLPSERLFLVSGTASIDRHGECVHQGDVLTQAGRLFLNIEKLLESAGGSLGCVSYFVVYLRDVSDYAAIRDYIRLRFPDMPFLLTLGRVCRPEWLIEVECVAQLNK